MNKVNGNHVSTLAPNTELPPTPNEKETGINVKVELRQAVIRLGRVRRAQATAERHYNRLYSDVVAIYGEQVAKQVVEGAYDD